MNSKKIVSITTGMAMFVAFAFAVPAFAENKTGMMESNENGRVNRTMMGGRVLGGHGTSTPRMNSKSGDDKGRRLASSTIAVIGNGRPIIAGTVSAIGTTTSSTTVTVTTTSGLTYSVDATNAKILRGQTTVTFSTIGVGDKIVAQGIVNGTSVVASTIIDQNITTTGQAKGGFLSGIGQFFMRLFGF